jgi:serine/threonine protein phosphatase PrpC
VKSLTDLFLDLKKWLTAKIIENCHHECKLDPSNTILMKSTYADTWQPLINGGATMTITILIKKTLKLYIANVGDTDAMLCSTKPILRQDDLKCENELKEATEDLIEATEDLIEATDYLMLTADHSPDNPKEFMRMCKIATHPSIPNKSTVNVIYDNQKVTNKKLCCPVFDTSKEIPTLLDCPVGNGYYKNVRKEYATYVATPEDRILAMTRTMGDFHMCAYGIVCEPTINSIDLSKILDRYEETDTQPTLCLLISSDGVWDNWLFKDVQNFMMYDTCLETVVSKPDGAQKVLDSFINRNTIFGRAHFGSSADNATSSVVYINK